MSTTTVLDKHAVPLPISKLVPIQAISARSIEEKGKEPVCVTKQSDGKYMLLDGHHRVAWAIKQGKTHIRAWILKEGDKIQLEDDTATSVTLICRPAGCLTGNLVVRELERVYTVSRWMNQFKFLPDGRSVPIDW